MGERKPRWTARCNERARDRRPGGARRRQRTLILMPRLIRTPPRAGPHVSTRPHVPLPRAHPLVSERLHVPRSMCPPPHICASSRARPTCPPPHVAAGPHVPAPCAHPHVSARLHVPAPLYLHVFRFPPPRTVRYTFTCLFPYICAFSRAHPHVPSRLPVLTPTCPPARLFQSSRATYSCRPRSERHDAP